MDFLKEIREFKSMLRAIINRQDSIEEQLSMVQTKIDEVLDKTMHTEIILKKSEDKFGACAKGFYQVKEACECLLEKIDECAGTITEQTWND